MRVCACKGVRTDLQRVSQRRESLVRVSQLRLTWLARARLTASPRGRGQRMKAREGVKGTTRDSEGWRVRSGE